MEIVVNGEAKSVPEQLSVQQLLAHLGVDPERVAVELDRRILKRERWAGTAVAAGSEFEIVQFVGGG
jgi:thiamine biosynthesis protein ThiS